MSDIVERLRRDKWHVSGVDCETAAQEIERLRAEVAALRHWIRDTGLQADICTRNILGEVCPYCQCGRAARKGTT